MIQNTTALAKLAYIYIHYTSLFKQCSPTPLLSPFNEMADNGIVSELPAQGWMHIPPDFLRWLIFIAGR